uniref:Uncharacterized protein n=1 Tax=viral metagenome TaxID=1070528 RepID=A0A6C0JV96_9ZZZZ
MQSIDCSLEWILEEGEYAPRLKGHRVLRRLPIVYLWTKDPEPYKQYKQYLCSSFIDSEEYLYFAVKNEYFDEWRAATLQEPPFDHDDNLLDINDDDITSIHDYPSLLGKMLLLNAQTS